LDLLRKDALPKGRIFVPGCGTGYDVVAMAGPDRYVVGMDISETCVRKSQKLFSGSPNVNYFTFLQGDFFKWNPEDKFDLIFDYTFFCAIDPSMRKAWGQKMRDILNPDGELDRKSTRLNSSHITISYAVFCLKKKKDNR